MSASSRASNQRSPTRSHDGLRLGRREFLARSALAGISAALLPLAGRAAEPPGVRRYVTLGRTGLRIPDIGFGASRLGDTPELVARALDRGITYFDTAESYRHGTSETTLGRALRGRRDRVVLASKVHAGRDDRRDALMAALEASLRRLQTDYVDVYFNHAVNDVARLQNPEWDEFAARARQQGKIRFTGMSGHGGRLIECLDYALDHDRVDVILVAHNFGQDPRFYERFLRSFDFVAVQPDLPRVMAKAKAKGVGVIAMKTLMGARLNDLRPFEEGGATFAQAAFRWVLSGDDVDALIVSMKTPEMIDEYLGASGWRRPRAADGPLLERYLARNGGTHCRHGCGVCLDACPYGVPIAEVLRTRMYARDYGEPELARDEYARLDADASACLTCAERTCAAACPFGLPVPALTSEAHASLGDA